MLSTASQPGVLPIPQQHNLQQPIVYGQALYPYQVGMPFYPCQHPHLLLHTPFGAGRQDRQHHDAAACGYVQYPYNMQYPCAPHYDGPPYINPFSMMQAAAAAHKLKTSMAFQGSRGLQVPPEGVGIQGQYCWHLVLLVEVLSS